MQFKKRPFNQTTMKIFLIIISFLSITIVHTVIASTLPDDKLWLRYENIQTIYNPSKYENYKNFFSSHKNIYCATDDKYSPVYSACKELSNGLSILFDVNMSIITNNNKTPATASIVIESLVDEYSILNISTKLSDEEFSISYGNHHIEVAADKLSIVSNTGRGVLYGVFHLLNLLQRNADELPAKIIDINIKEQPKSRIRIWELWDNMDGTIERGYGGRSIFHWEELPNIVRPRYEDYARYLASVGINSISLTNVNSCFTMNQQLLNITNINKAAVLGKLFASYGIATFLTPCFDSPMLVGNLNTSDPFDPRVIQWWKEIVIKLQNAFQSSRVTTTNNKKNASIIMNSGFIGFLFKADSEGMPGPSSYNRTEPEGSSMLANAVKDIGGIIIWRAFTHPGNLGPIKVGDQPLMQFKYFMELDGLWDENVVLQIKNGPMDFQTHEPVHSLFGNLKNTKVMIELGVTQEYTGQAYHLCHLPVQWENYLTFNTGCTSDGINNYNGGGKMLLLADVLTKGKNGWGFAGVSNFGETVFWTGNLLSSSNSFGYGRMAWNPYTSAKDITKEWVELTFGIDMQITKPIVNMMMDSWYIYENYTSPFGLSAIDDNCADRKQCFKLPNGMLEDRVDHYWWAGWLWAGVGKPPNAGYGGGFNLSRNDRMIGNNRSLEYGQTYCGKENKEIFGNIKQTPLRLLLTFHHVSYDYVLDDGRTLMDNIMLAFQLGQENAENKILNVWKTLKTIFINNNDQERWENVYNKLNIGIGEDTKNFTRSALNYFTD